MFLCRTSSASLGALVLGGALLAWTAPADAGARTGTWRNGMVAGPMGVGYYGGYRPAFGGFRPAYHGYRGAPIGVAYRPYPRPAYGGFHGGYRRPAFYGGYRPAYGYGYRHRRRDSGAALAAGLVGGLALGALATAPYRYSYAAPYGGYYGASYYGGPVCHTVRRRAVDAWGRLVITHRRICE
jgi:hypothetical protein